MAATFQIYNVLEKRSLVNTRVQTMDDFLKALEINLERELYTSGFRIIFLAEDEIVSTGGYIENFSSFFNEAFENGTVNGEPKDIMIGATKSDLIDSMNEKASKINANVFLSDVSTSYSQVDPWNVQFVFSFNLSLEDNSNLARWERFQEITTLVGVEGFEDPIYIVNTNALVSRKINRTIYEGNYVVDSDISNFYSHVFSGYYAESVNSPSFLNRLEGNLSQDDNGIESFVNLAELDSQGLPISDKTTTDHIYFSGQNPTHYGVTGMPSWFGVDDLYRRLEKYNLTKIIY
ncbi:hypothetical protein COU54_02820 [Candidatus Pacearchaeota archaeon CG10_big_fil_rev_8_21_14_0_10_31_24]|nr:MAG: hypothetical protein COU54_02820 [Candidatus Pacearchaeota archaeon CG10_big_fil_rev_8_21_14_0_10_31_24]